jgi:hypothetical protein
MRIGSSERSRKDEGWKLETGNWKLETGNWKPETGNWKLETGYWKSAIGMFVRGVSGGMPEATGGGDRGMKGWVR